MSYSCNVKTEMGGLSMLIIEKVNLYDHYRLEKLPERAGNLTCIYFSTGWEISTSRVRPAVLIMPGGGYHAVSDR